MKTPHLTKTFSLPVHPRLLFRDHCIKEAKAIRLRRDIEHMSELQIAQELYFHARVYYFCRFLRRFHIHLRWLMHHANPIDLSDHGDTKFRQFCFRLFWLLPGGRSGGTGDHAQEEASGTSDNG